MFSFHCSLFGVQSMTASRVRTSSISGEQRTSRNCTQPTIFFDSRLFCVAPYKCAKFTYFQVVRLSLLKKHTNNEAASLVRKKRVERGASSSLRSVCFANCHCLCSGRRRRSRKNLQLFFNCIKYKRCVS